MQASDQGAGGEPPGNADSQDGHGHPDGAREGDAATGQTSVRLSASFVSATEAEVALRCLAPGARPFRGAVRRALTVIGSQLLVRIAAENSGLLQISIASLFNQLSLVAQAMQRFVPPGTSHRGTRVWGPILSLALG
uniref:L antigen family member 3 n=1 Tax=Oryctolagus cuniculus TaxID=9986 RepID=A0A5F9D7L5_RABIT